MTISGCGFAPGGAAGGVLARFGSAPCDVLSSTATAITCRTRGQPGGGPFVSLPLSLVPAAGAPETTFDGSGNATSPNVTTSSRSVMMSFDPALTPRVAPGSFGPLRGSTEGGTPMRLTLTNVPAGITAADVSVSLGALPCVNVTVGNVTATAGASMASADVACVTSRPPTRSWAPLPLQVTVAGAGLAATNASYTYVDLWSRRSTWGGNPPPVQGANVHHG